MYNVSDRKMYSTARVYKRSMEQTFREQTLSELLYVVCISIPLLYGYSSYSTA